MGGGGIGTPLNGNGGATGPIKLFGGIEQDDGPAPGGKPGPGP